MVKCTKAQSFGISKLKNPETLLKLLEFKNHQNLEHDNLARS